MTEAIASFEVISACAGTDAPIPTRARRGTTVMEYVLMLSLILSVGLAGFGYFGQANNTIRSGVSDSLNDSMNKETDHDQSKSKGKGNGKS